jgi:hypothetical protein
MAAQETYFDGHDDGITGSSNPQTPEGLEGLHRWLYRGAVFFFVALAVDGFIIFPLMLIKYGWH